MFILIGLSSLYTFHLTAGDDFAAGPYNVNFTAGQQSATLMLPTVDDNATELCEYLKVLIEQVLIIRVINKPFFDVTVVIVSQYCLWIYIKDNDPGTTDDTITASI